MKVKQLYGLAFPVFFKCLDWTEKMASLNDYTGENEPMVVHQFYHSHAFPYLIRQYEEEIRRLLIDVPIEIRQANLAPPLIELGETGGDEAWEVFRSYLDVVENRIADIVRRHSPAFWFHLHRRIKPTLANIHEGKTDNVTVTLVRQIAELAYAKHGEITNTNDLGPILSTRMKSFLDSAWYLATSEAFASKLKAKKRFNALKWTGQVVMTDFRRSDLCDVFEIEGLCYEYWWASAVMRSIGKGAAIKWDPNVNPSLRYRDTDVHPLCFALYDIRNEKAAGLVTRLGTWTLSSTDPYEDDIASGACITIAVLTPNPDAEEYPAWNPALGKFSKGFNAKNFGLGMISLKEFEQHNSFMAEPFKVRHGIRFEAVLFAVWAASFFATFTGIALYLKTEEMRTDSTMKSIGNLLFRGYTMMPFKPKEIARKAVDLAKLFEHEYVPSVNEAVAAIEFITLRTSDQGRIALWSGGKRPIILPALDGVKIDLAAIVPFLSRIFFGLKKVPQVGGEAFEESVRKAVTASDFEIPLQGKIHWKDGAEREVDVSVRIDDRLVILECFSYELPLDYEIGKPSVFECRKKFISGKLSQASSLADRLANEPVGRDFDVSWARTVEWRVVSPFVEFAWHLQEPLWDANGVARILQVSELLDYLLKNRAPAEKYMSAIKNMRDSPPEGIWS